MLAIILITIVVLRALVGAPMLALAALVSTGAALSAISVMTLAALCVITLAVPFAGVVGGQSRHGQADQQSGRSDGKRFH